VAQTAPAQEQARPGRGARPAAHGPAPRRRWPDRPASLGNIRWRCVSSGCLGRHGRGTRMCRRASAL